MNVKNGYKGCFASWSSFTTGCEKGCKIGVLVDMFEGSIKYFINNEDKGWAFQNEKGLTEKPLFITIVSEATGTFRLLAPPSNQPQVLS